MKKSERALLTQLNSLLSNQDAELQKGKKYQYILSLVGGAMVLSGFYLVSYGIISGEVGVALAATGGAIIGMAGYIRIVRGVLPVISPHLNGDSIRECLNAAAQDK